MAEEIGKAVVGELVGRGTSLLINTYNHKCRTDLEEKLDRLEMLVLKLQSISEVSNSYAIAGHIKLCRLKEKFDEAARQGDDIIRLFKERASRERSTEDSQSGYSIASVSKNAAKCVKRWFSGDDDADKLNDVLKRLESVNDEVSDFLKLVKMNKKILVLSRSRESSARRQAKRTIPLRACLQGSIDSGEQVVLQMADQKMYCVRRISDLPILSDLFGLPRQIANWVRMIAVAATLLCGWFSSKYSNKREIIRVERLITMINNRIRDVEQEKNQSPILADWLKKVREVTSEGEIELRFLKSRKIGLKGCISNQHTLCLGSLLSRLEKAAKDTENIWEALTLTERAFTSFGASHRRATYHNGED